MKLNVVELASYYQEIVEGELIEVNIKEFKSIEDYDIFIGGHFNPWFEKESLSVPIEITLIVSYNSLAVVDTESEEFSNFDNEFIKTVNHEMVHLEQYREGRFIKNWKGDYADNPNEIEAYDKE